jgi:hypothetical protein
MQHQGISRAHEASHSISQINELVMRTFSLSQSLRILRILKYLVM